MAESPKTYKRRITYADYKAGKLKCGNRPCGAPIPPDEKVVVSAGLSSLQQAGYVQDGSTPFNANHICDACGACNTVIFSHD